MAMTEPRPMPLHAVISVDQSPPCIDCAYCKVSPKYPLVTTGLCLSPENEQDGRGSIAEIIADVNEARGTCGGYARRSRGVVGESA